jgi:hypothetical protein
MVREPLRWRLALEVPAHAAGIALSHSKIVASARHDASETLARQSLEIAFEGGVPLPSTGVRRCHSRADLV